MRKSLRRAFPRLWLSAAADLPDGTVIDGEVVAWLGGRVRPFSHLQQRIGRLKLTAKILKDVPAHFIAYDLLELSGEDIRPRPLHERRAALASFESSVITLSPQVPSPTWGELEVQRGLARERCGRGNHAEALGLRYGTGRQRGAWWKWKIDPFVFDAVLLYAAPGNGRRSNLYTDYTFGVRQGDALVPVAKAYSGLNAAEIQELDRWIRTHTQEKFGIVRQVQAFHVFELAYEGIARSTRHKSGIAMRFPRIVRWRRDKPAAEADSLADLEAVARAGGGADGRRAFTQGLISQPPPSDLYNLTRSVLCASNA